MIYEKPKNEIFASDAKDGEIVEFPNVKRGWGVTENLGFIPPMEYFNAAFNRVDKALAYQMQRGVSEWSADEEYPVGALSVFNGTLYQAKTQNINKKPSEDTSLWGVVVNEGWADTNLLGKTEKAADADKLDGLDSTAFVQKNTDAVLSTLHLTSNNIGDNLKIGDDAYLGDVGTNSTLGIKGIGNEGKGFIRFGKDGPTLGNDGDNTLTCNGARVVLGVDFACQKNPNGYTKLPNGLILQWGSIAEGLPGERAFPIAFPNIVLAVIAGNTNAQGVGVDNAFAYAISKEKFYYGTKTNQGPVSAFPGSYIAIGY